MAETEENTLSAADLAALSERTVAIYDAVGAAYDAQRGRHLFERGWLDRFMEAAPGPRMLDLGCGGGSLSRAICWSRGRR